MNQSNPVAKNSQLYFCIYLIFGTSIKYCNTDSKTAVLSHISLFPLFQYNVIEILVRITEMLTPIVLFCK